jgi:hypothetical protein
MFKLSACAAAVVMLTAGHAAASTNTITIDPAVPGSNILELQIAGNDNALVISQSAPLGAEAANRMQISLTGDENGGAGGSFTGAALLSGLSPGHLSQSGEGNLIALSVRGIGNLFAVSQTGSFNSVTGTILGRDNQTTVIQNGAGNQFSFAQSGNGNMINVSQTSW